MKKRQFPRSRPDPLLEEVLEVLGSDGPYDLNGLFEIVHAKLRARNAAHSGQEMLRLRTYEKLQGLMKEGAVKKTGKLYETIPDKFQALHREFTEQSAKLRANRPEAKKAA